MKSSNNATKPKSVYVLQLEGGKYYVGRSVNPKKRFAEHLNGQGSAWTSQYTPIRLLQTTPSTSPFDENKVTKEFMAKYGVENVRGGSYSSVELDDIQQIALEREMRAAEDACMRCGRKGHFVKDCYAATDVSGERLESADKIERGQNDGDEDSDDDACYRCGRSGHFASQCYAKTIVSSSSSPATREKEVVATCYRCGRTGHYSSKCYAKTIVVSDDREEERTDTCYRCGRTGHYASDCYAKTFVSFPSSSSSSSSWYERERSDTCYRCGRSGHYASQCYARTSVWK